LRCLVGAGPPAGLGGEAFEDAAGALALDDDDEDDAPEDGPFVGRGMPAWLVGRGRLVFRVGAARVG